MTFSIPQVQDAFDEYELGLEESVEHLKIDLSAIRAGRANPQILNKVYVDYYGAQTPLTQMANITVPEARLLQISLWDTSMIKEAVKAINASDIGITPTDDGRLYAWRFRNLRKSAEEKFPSRFTKSAKNIKWHFAMRAETCWIKSRISRKTTLLPKTMWKLTAKKYRKFSTNA